MTPGDPRNEHEFVIEESPRRRAYAAPDIAWSEDTEIRANLASACGQQQGNPGGDCGSSPFS